MTVTATSRRRFITIAAGATAALAAGPSRAAATSGILRWRGVAMGAEATILLPARARARGEALIGRCLDELRRLEAEFSLYRSDSAISRLNATGRLAAPSLDFYRLLSDCGRFHRMTNGAFDPTVQPLWRLYADHFAAGRDADGPSSRDLARALFRVGFENVEVSTQRIAFARTGMAITLNGVAQGYVTDRVADLLRANGLETVLVDMGEIRVLGRSPDGRPWRVGRPRWTDGAEPVTLEDAAIATSFGRATPFDRTGRFHHLFDPASGRCTRNVRSVSVVAPTAAEADALSTALTAISVERWPTVLARFPHTNAMAVADDGSQLRV